MYQHSRFLPAIDALLTSLVVALVLGSALCFGGAVWWFRPAFTSLAFFLALAMLIRLLHERRLPILKSPLTLLAFLALGLGLLQLIPLPAALAHRLSPTAHEIYSFGVIPDLVRADLPSAKLPASRLTCGRLQRSTGLPACAGSAGPLRAWESSGPSRILQIVSNDSTWCGVVCWPPSC